MIKSIIMSLLVVAATFNCSVADTPPTGSYQVYSIKLTGKSTKAGGIAQVDCGSYYYRDTANVNISGILAGCGCAETIANGTCDNHLMIFWNETTKKQITNIQLQQLIVQRIAKRGNKSELIYILTMMDEDGWECQLTLSGFGGYKASRYGTEYSTFDSTGYFAGYMTAPYILGTCSICTVTPDEITTALPVCDTECTISQNSEITPYSGRYKIKYDSSKTKKCLKNGINAKSLGIPDYVTLD